MGLFCPRCHLKPFQSVSFFLFHPAHIQSKYIISDPPKGSRHTTLSRNYKVTLFLSVPQYFHRQWPPQHRHPLQLQHRFPPPICRSPPQSVTLSSLASVSPLLSTFLTFTSSSIRWPFSSGSPTSSRPPNPPSPPHSSIPCPSNPSPSSSSKCLQTLSRSPPSPKTLSTNPAFRF